MKSQHNLFGEMPRTRKVREVRALPIVCLFCGNREEHRFMCAECRPKAYFKLIGALRGKGK